MLLHSISRTATTRLFLPVAQQAVGVFTAPIPLLFNSRWTSSNANSHWISPSSNVNAHSNAAATAATASVFTILLGLGTSCSVSECESTPAKDEEEKSIDIIGSTTHSRTGILPLPSKTVSLQIQEKVRQLASEKELPSSIMEVALPNVEDLFNNQQSITPHGLAADVTAINHYHERVLKHPEMLDKLKDDWSRFQVDAELKKIRAGKEANQIEKSFKRTQYFAECIRLCIRCVNERLINYNMKYYRNKKDDINDYEDIRSFASNNRVTAFLPNDKVDNGAKEEGDDDGDADGDADNEDKEESPPNDTVPFDCDGDNMRRLKHHEIYLKGSPVKSKHLLTYERHEMASCDSQYGALLVELIQTAVFRSYDLVGKWHCCNRSYFAPVFDHFDLETSKASKHCSATVLVSSEPFENGSVGINVDYSLAFNANCFLKNAKLYRAAKRKSGTQFTHDARWLMFESVLGEWREKQNVKAGDHFIPNLDLLGSLKGLNGMSVDTVRLHWKSITGERKVGVYTNLQNWQIQSIKKYGIHLDDAAYKTRLREDINRRNQVAAVSASAKFSTSNRSRWGKSSNNANKRQKKK